MLLAQELGLFVQAAPLFPESEIHNILSTIIASQNSKAKAQLTQAIVLLHKNWPSPASNEYLLSLLQDPSSDVVASVILQSEGIVAAFG